MIVETIFSTQDSSGSANFAPMGVQWGEENLILRPFRDTRTCHNLLSTGYGVINLTDDVLAFVQSALYDAVLSSFPARAIPGIVFQNTCAWREVEVVSEGGSPERAEVNCRVVYRGWLRDFVGICRAQSAVIEATILATRIHLYARNNVLEDLKQYEQIVQKTGDDREKIAFQQASEFIKRKMSDDRN
jgi:hypothetical protein